MPSKLLSADGWQGNMTIPRALLALLAALACGLAVSTALGSETQSVDDIDPTEGGLIVDWTYRPDDLNDLVSESRATLVGEVTAISPGPPLAGEAYVPTQRVEIATSETLEGSAPQSFILFSIGSEEVFSTENPPFAIGESYLLFVERRLNDDLSAPNPDGTYLLTAPDGRLEEASNGELVPVVDGPVADELGGATVEQAEEQVDEAVGAEGP